jgi:hypothetical protein
MNKAYSMGGNMKYAYNILVSKPEGEKPFGRPRCRWEDDIKMVLEERMYVRAWAGLNWLGVGTSEGLLQT